MRKREKHQIRKAFVEAKKFLSETEKDPIVNGLLEKYICYAIEAAAYKNKISFQNSSKALVVISKGLGNFTFASSWARAHGYKGDMQKWRHAWLDRLIKEYS